MKHKHSHPSHEAGITLIEVLLVVGLLSGIMLVLTLLLQDFARREHMRAVAGQMSMVQKAVIEQVSKVDAFAALYQLAQDNGGVAEISILDPLNPDRTLSSGYGPTGGVSLESGGGGLAPNAFINVGADPSNPGSYSGFRDTLPIRAADYRTEYDNAVNVRQDARLSILVRAAGSADDRALEILIVSVDRLREADIRGIAAAMDASGGFVSGYDDDPDNICHDTGCANTARSAFGNWYAHLPQFSGTRWYDTVITAHPADMNAEQGYLASYSYISEAVIAGDYLYRVAVPGNPDLNRMYTPFNLGGNDILGADNVEINSNTGYALTVNQAIHAQGSAFVGGNLLVEGDLIADGDVQAGTIRLEPDGAVPPGAARSVGNIVAGNRFKTRYLNTGGSVSVSGDAQIRGGSATGVVSSRLQVNSLEGASASALVGQLDNAGTLNASGMTQAGHIRTGTVNSQSIGIVQGQMTGSGAQMRVDGGVNAQGGKILSRGGVSIDNLTRCEIGC